MKRAFLLRHWETALLLAVAVLCAFSISSLNDQSASSQPADRSSILGLTAPEVEKAVLATDPGAQSNLSVNSGRRSISYSISSPTGEDGSITVSSTLADGAVTSVSCGAYSSPLRPLTVAGNAVLKFCATLPVTGAGTDTVAWLDQQFAAAAVGYSKTQNHSGVQYDLSYSQYDNNRTHYEVTVLPPLRM